MLKSVQQPPIAEIIAEVAGNRMSVMSLVWRLIRLKNQKHDGNSDP